MNMNSMGGPVVVDAALKVARKRKLIGVVVIDVVEGTAIEALEHMKRILNTRPKQMKSIGEAIRYSISTGAIKSEVNAQISVPSQLRQLQLSDGTICYEWKADLTATESYWKGLALCCIFISQLSRN
jgi:protein phosphatase methylesterase 1